MGILGTHRPVCVLSHFSCAQLFAAPPGSSVQGSLQASMLEWTAMPPRFILERESNLDVPLGVSLGTGCSSGRERPLVKTHLCTGGR